MRRHPGEKEAQMPASDAGLAGGHLDEVASLLALGISRLNARRKNALEGFSSAGLFAEIKRVLGQENGP